jgi:hypothetical protein
MTVLMSRYEMAKAVVAAVGTAFEAVEPQQPKAFPSVAGATKASPCSKSIRSSKTPRTLGTLYVVLTRVGASARDPTALAQRRPGRRDPSSLGGGSGSVGSRDHSVASIRLPRLS